MIEKYPIEPPDQSDGPKSPRWPAEDCKHNWELRKLTCSNGTIQYKNQCLLCGAASNAIAHSKLTKKQMDNAPPFDPDMKTPAIEKYYKDRERYIQERGQFREEGQITWWSWYHGYLASEIWERRRVMVLDREDWICQSCGERATTVHHLTYERVGQEPLFDLVAVCRICHETLHQRENRHE